MTGKIPAVGLEKFVLLAGFAALVSTGSDVRADRIVLRGGGQIRGKVIPDPAHPKMITVLTEKGKAPLTFEKPKVVEVVPEPSILDDYVVKKDKAVSTAESQFALGQWCEEHKLPGLATSHYEAALRYDKAFAPAHQKLGHVLYADRWLTQDELREAQGLVRYKGKWMTKEEKETREAQSATTGEQATWVRRLKRLREALFFGNEAKQQSAEDQIRAIKEPIAVKPLLIVFGDSEAPAVRTLLDSVLGTIDGPEAARALAVRLLMEGDGQVRQAVMEQLARREEPVVVPQLVKALRSENPAIVNRAAWGLGNLNDATVVPSLISALVTTQYRVVMGEGEGGNGGAVGMNFGSVGIGTGAGGVPVAYGVGGPPIAYNGSSVAYMVGPVVGPGVVAYGAATAPAFGLPGTALPYSGGAPATGRGPIPKLVPVVFQNIEVLGALTKLTNQDFGYNADAWKRWVSRSFKPETAPARKVAQP